MKTLARIGIVSAVLLAGACKDGHHDHHGQHHAYSTTWDAIFEGYALDDFNVPIGEVVEPVYLQLSPAGGGKYSVNFDGFLPFLVLDDFGFSLGWFDFPLNALDFASGDLFFEPGIPNGSLFSFWGGVRLNDFDLGITDVDLVFQLRFDGPTIESSNYADLIWDAGLYSSGSIFTPPGFAVLSGVTTLAIRVE